MENGGLNPTNTSKSHRGDARAVRAPQPTKSNSVARPIHEECHPVFWPSRYDGLPNPGEVKDFLASIEVLSALTQAAAELQLLLALLLE